VENCDVIRAGVARTEGVWRVERHRWPSWRRLDDVLPTAAVRRRRRIEHMLAIQIPRVRQMGPAAALRRPHVHPTGACDHLAETPPPSWC